MIGILESGSLLHRDLFCESESESDIQQASSCDFSCFPLMWLARVGNTRKDYT
jgi:hypothetical protein